MMKRFLVAAAAATLMAGIAGYAEKAEAVLVGTEFDGNDCAGFFNPDGTSGFSACTIFIDQNGDQIQLSPIIAKTDGNGDVSEINSSLYPTIDGSEFNVSFNDSESGSWTYNPGDGDPGVRYWVAKGGNGFNLFWDVDSPEAAVSCTAGIADSNFNLTCLQAANVVTAGDWETTTGGFSHFAWYDSENPTIIPVPAAAWLFLTGLAGLFGFRRFKSRAAA